MSRDDVASLVIRTFALWLGATGLGALFPIPWMIEGPGGRGAMVMVAFALLAAAAIVWLAAPRLTRAMFARPDRDVPFALSARGIPALASFVTGLYTLAGAIPAAFSSIVLLVMRKSISTSVMNGTAAFDVRMVESGAQALAHVAVGIALLALSRRPDFWPLPDDTDRPASGDPPAE